MNVDGKLQDKPKLEMRHNFQRRFHGRMTTSGMAMWVAQRLAEARKEETERDTQHLDAYQIAG